MSTDITRRAFVLAAPLGLAAASATVALAKDAATPSTTPATSAAQARSEMQWWQDTVVYEAYPKSFLDTRGQGTGTLAGITSKLDHIASLGAGAIWLTPVYASPMRDNGYDISDYTAINPSFGTMDDMDEFIAEAAKRNIRLVMDLVLNHTSNEHPWFLESSASRDNAKADWYIWADPKADGSAPTNWRGIFGGSAWTWCESRQQYYLHTFADFQPDLNWECPELRQELYRISRGWLERGLGGFRIDAVTYIKKPAFEDGTPDAEDGLSGIHDMTANTPGILDFIREFKHEVMEGSDAFTVAEANGVPAEQLPEWVGENGAFDMLFQFTHQTVPLGGKEIWYRPADWKLTELKGAISESESFTAGKGSGWYPIYWENHDQPRSINHFCPGASDANAAGKMLATLLMTLRGTPFIYQGEELGYTNVAWDSIDDYDDVSSHNQYAMALENGCSEEEAMAAVHGFSRDNARTPMQWDASAHAGFSTAEPWLPVHDDYETCNVEVQAADDASVLSWYRRLALLREECDVLVSGDYEELLAEDERVFAFRREAGPDVAVVLANFSGESVPYDEGLVEGLELVLSSCDGDEPGVLEPWGSVVFAGTRG